jgi:hypothetical protein
MHFCFLHAVDFYGDDGYTSKWIPEVKGVYRYQFHSPPLPKVGVVSTSLSGDAGGWRAAISPRNYHGPDLSRGEYSRYDDRCSAMSIRVFWQ